MHEQLAMDYCRKVHCLLPHGQLDGLCTQECYVHEPFAFSIIASYLSACGSDS